MRKNIRYTFVGLLVLVMALLAGCGSGGAAKKSAEPFNLGEYTYKLGPVARSAEDDTDSEEAYKVTLLIKGDTAPIIISNGVTKAGVELTLVDGDDKYNYKMAGFKVIPEEERDGEFGASAEFTFKLPKGSTFPAKAIANDGSNPDETYELDLSGVEIQE